jgi:hypothetical protein
MNLKVGFVVGCVSVAVASPATADFIKATGPRSELCNKLQKTVTEVTGMEVAKVTSLDVAGAPLKCIYAPKEGWQRFNFELPDGDAKKLAEWRANYAKGPKMMTALTDLPELGPGAFRASSGGGLFVHGLAKKRLLIVGGTSAKPEVEINLWKKIAAEL